MTTESTDLAVQREAELAALAAQQEQEFDDTELQVPIIKVGQPLTKEVQAEQAEPGEFIDTVIGEGLGNKLDFIVSYFQYGRFAADRETNKGYSAFGDLIPEWWEDLPFIGPGMVGTRFDEHPDAEEQYKARVNAGEIEWGKGPKISTTWNFTGLYIVSPDEDDPDAEEEYAAGRLSLQRTQVPGAKKIIQLKKMRFRNRQFWEYIFEFTTQKKDMAKGPVHLVIPKLGRVTTPYERELASELAINVAAGRVRDNSEQTGDTEAAAEPDAKGGLAV